MAKKSLPGTKEQPGKHGKMGLKEKGAKESDSDNLGKKAKGGRGGFKNKAMEHKR